MGPCRRLTLPALVLWGLSAVTGGVPMLGAWPGPGEMGQRAADQVPSATPAGWSEAPPRRAPDSLRGNTPEGAVFADWVVSTDPEHRYLIDAFVRDDRILGVIVHPQLTRGQVQQMLTSLLSAMQRSFPDRPLEVIAYYRSGDQLARLTWDAQTKQARTVWRR